VNNWEAMLFSTFLITTNGCRITWRNRSFPRLWSRSLFFERKHQNSKQWPKQPRLKLLLQISNYLASFRRKLQYPFG